jgi:hypothetical protein
VKQVGSRCLGEFALPRFCIVCQRCGRAGNYRLEGLIDRFGKNAALPDVLMELAACKQDFSVPCGVRLADWAAHPRRSLI